jgi:hypothetical protein
VKARVEATFPSLRGLTVSFSSKNSSAKHRETTLRRRSENNIRFEVIVMADDDAMQN